MSRSKKFKPVTSAKELVPGQIYIRAVVNYYGKFWYEISRVDANVKLLKDSLIKKPFIGVEVSTIRLPDNKYKKALDFRIGDFVTTKYKPGFIAGHTLFKFSNKLKCFLDKNSGDVWQFLEAIHNRTFHQEERDIISYSGNFYKKTFSQTRIKQ